MDIELIEKNNENQINELSKKRKYTVNSIDSAPEFQHKTYLSKTIMSMSFLSLIIGIYILFNKSYYLNENYNFEHAETLNNYVLIYTFGLFCVLITAFILALMIKFISSLCRKPKRIENNEEKNNSIEEENDDEDNFLSQILQNADNISMIPYTSTICVILTIILYVFGFPLSWYLIFGLIKHNIYSNINQFLMLYLFIFINSISGAIFIFVLISFIKVKRDNSVRKLSFTYDEENLLAVYKEVKDAIDLVK